MAKTNLGSTTRGERPMSQQRVADETELELTTPSDSSERVKQVVTAGILASLSIAVAPTASMIARIAGWGIALFDPVSLFWIAAFLIGGRSVGIISMSAGTLGLFLYDPTGIGPVFKFFATLPMILVPSAGVLRRKSQEGGAALLLANVSSLCCSIGYYDTSQLSLLGIDFANP
jgi:hypothetical protein